ncbi:hypothetical protein EQM14_07840 [Caproiciproducens sp. NJN-50]|uniref:DUF6873 family GME fold protein n=1 Tax=Acutalibacteraceae TaxID=3082771 RepID=UPI000FFE2B90|nr:MULTISPECIES: hypothetical protein [Acutalibacteraceae]QAT49690.1 hypothetical protein EQM14_07840 [Caproiciproducens sp. NJN-50]
MRYIQTPNLPETDVSLLTASAAYPGILMELKRLGISAIPVDPSKSLPAPVQAHADMLCHPLGGRRVIVAKGEKRLAADLKQFGFKIIESVSSIAGSYPNDSGLNAARVGNKLIANPQILDKAIWDDCLSKGIKIIEVRQGYTKCSTAVVDEHSIITSDDGIATAAFKAGLEVLKIQPGHIRLPGYSYGFIGGCCGLIGRNRMAFAGNPNSHPDFCRIKEFLDRREIEVIILSKDSLLDIGGMIPLMEGE